jgi:hypothetical protein
MPQESPARLWSIDQTFIDDPIDPIEARIVHEKDLETADLQWLLGADLNSPRSVGISPAYSQSGGLPALACAFGTRVIIINFHRSKYSRKDPGGTQRRNDERRDRLEKELLCNPYCTHYAFDLAPLALSLRLHLNIHIANAIDIQSALLLPTRDVIDSVRFIVGDAPPFFPENITSAFESTLYESNKEKDLTTLVQRAWLCGYLGQFDLGNIQDMFYKAPKVDMTKFSDGVSRSVGFNTRLFSLHFFKELDVLQKMAHDMLRLDNLKPQSVTHEIKTRWNTKTQQVVAESQRYSNRMTANSSVSVQSFIPSNFLSFILSRDLKSP